MASLKRCFIILLLISVCILPSFAQTRFSLGTDLSLQRSLKKDQQFWVVGHTLAGHWHFSSRTGVYALLSYYGQGSFRNELFATAKSPATTPQQVGFINKADIRLKQVSIGLKKYLIGRYDTDKWNVYGLAGFGLVWGKVANSYEGSVDTSLYMMPPTPVSGTGRFKRLTFDIGAGWELAIGDEIYFYTEAKLWIPTTEYPSKYLFVNNNSPLVATLGAGIRILF